MGKKKLKLEDLIGQDKIKEILRISIDSSKTTSLSIPHMLFQGPPGLGKSTFAEAVAEETGANYTAINGSTIENSKSLIQSLVKAGNRDIIFIDEIHAMPKKVFELMYMPLQDKKLLLQQKDKKTKQDTSITIPLNDFTLIAATTNIGMIPRPLLDRIGLQFYLNYYMIEDIVMILEKNLENIPVRIEKDAIADLAARCKGVPRIAKSYLRWVVDFAIANKIQTLSATKIKEACDLYGVSDTGLNQNDMAYLNSLRSSDEPIGLSTISSMIDIPERAILEHIEPYLIRKGLIIKTKSGRSLSKNGEEYDEL